MEMWILQNWTFFDSLIIFDRINDPWFFENFYTSSKGFYSTENKSSYGKINVFENYSNNKSRFVLTTKYEIALLKILDKKGCNHKIHIQILINYVFVGQ